MSHAWVPVDAGTDTTSLARALKRAYDGGLPGPDLPDVVRPVVAESWARSVRGGIDPRERVPLMLGRAEVRQVFERHPLFDVAAVVKGMASRVAEYAPHVMALANRDGLVMWTRGHAGALQAAETVRFVPGALWDESIAGTNALGTALLLDHPLMIFSAEHFKMCLHRWSSSCAPIHDPERGELLGAVVLFGPFKTAHPHGFSLVVNIAEMAEARLAHAASERDDRLRVEYLEMVLRRRPDASGVVNPAGKVLLCNPPGWLGRRVRLAADGQPLPTVSEEITIERLRRGRGHVIMSGLGVAGQGRRRFSLQMIDRDRAIGRLDDEELHFTPRHSEILAIMAAHPAGRDEDELSELVYGSTGKRMTLRAEISRLRRLLGPVVMTRPYRLAADVRADFLEITDLIERGEFVSAAKRYSGPLLPSSTAPGVVALRDGIDAKIGVGASCALPRGG
jgi:transcriptional regulator of acetoin/glycerol metabolism